MKRGNHPDTLWLRLLKSLAKLFRRTIFILIPLTAVVAVTTFRAKEINATGYRKLQNAYKAGSSAFQLKVAEAMQDGTVSLAERSALMHQYSSENQTLPAEWGVLGDVAAEREALSALIRD